jgi:hypothetical protein
MDEDSSWEEHGNRGKSRMENGNKKSEMMGDASNAATNSIDNLGANTQRDREQLRPTAATATATAMAASGSSSSEYSSSNGHAASSNRHTMLAGSSLATRSNSTLAHGHGQQQQHHNHHGGPSRSSRHAQTCAKCGQPMTGSFVRALGTVFHLDCFRCQVKGACTEGRR